MKQLNTDVKRTRLLCAEGKRWTYRTDWQNLRVTQGYFFRHGRLTRSFNESVIRDPLLTPYSIGIGNNREGNDHASMSVHYELKICGVEMDRNPSDQRGYMLRSTLVLIDSNPDSKIADDGPTRIPSWKTMLGDIRWIYSNTYLACQCARLHIIRATFIYVCVICSTLSWKLLLELLCWLWEYTLLAFTFRFGLSLRFKRKPPSMNRK